MQNVAKNVLEDTSVQHRKDEYFMEIAKVVATQSKCLSRQIGSVLVKDNHIIATGYNGPARGIPHCEYRDDEGKYKSTVQAYICPRRRMGYEHGEGVQHCPAVHSEINTIIQAARFGTSTEGSTLYCYCGIPCHNCTKELINAGVKRVVCAFEKEYSGNKISSREMFEQADVKLEFLGETDGRKQVY